MNNKEYVNYEQAKALKAAGFNFPCDTLYHISHCRDKKVELWENRSIADWNYERYSNWAISAPTIYQAAKWLREAKGIAINVIAHDGGIYDFDIVFLPNADEAYGVENRSPLCRTYEEALSEGIDEALKTINYLNW